ncbi:c-type cytochrome [Limisphaera ngatamarikiensis]|uniref:C-type cytochrome n=1 Tax=Limisphaera ngatamarikiensis TaxID=1324935 RepID=A0A6M1RYH4_9BACT|nr:PVC-type heme-binding CxxCH protein [Limisphaera ngatamarikiensis]NGO38230.1 c-type cytochrome [Limisphaera ngatamarikiensis]
MTGHGRVGLMGRPAATEAGAHGPSNAVGDNGRATARPSARLRRRGSLALGVCLLCIAVSARARAQTTNAAALESEFQLAPGFRIQLVAAEPLVFDPVAMAFDGNGRLFVAEHRAFPEPDEAPPHLGRIRLLIDTDGDGRMDVSHDFADNIAAPSALFCWSNGVLVASGSRVIFCQDTNHDGRADVQEVIYSGPAQQRGRAGNGLWIRNWAWGWDNRLHAAARGLGLTLLPSPEQDALSAGLDDHDLALDPLSGVAMVESGYGASAVAFDAEGCKLVAQPARPVLEELWRTPHVDLARGLVLPPALHDLTGPLAEQPLTAVPSGGPVTTHRPGSPPARRWFSEVTALTVYRGALFPTAYSNDVFVADARAGVIRRYKLVGTGPERMALRPASDRSEFLVSTNPWFRPMQLTVGPEGALYVVDLHREYFDLHPPMESAAEPHDRARHQRGADRGRIYRIVPEKFRNPPAPQLEEAPLLEVLRALAHSNVWQRETAARLIYQRQDRTAIPLLSNMLAVARNPMAREAALNALGGLNALHPAILSRALQDTNPGVRLQAVRWMASMADTGTRVPENLWVPLRRLSSDPSPRVRYELALLTARYVVPGRELTLLDIVRRQPESPYTRAAVLLSLAREPGDCMAMAVLDPVLTRHPGGRLFLQDLARLLGRLQYTPGIQQALTFVQRTEDVELALSLLSALQEGLQERGDTLARHAPAHVFEPAWQRALVMADNRGLPVATRLDAIRLLPALPYAVTHEVLAARLLPIEPAPVQAAALVALGIYQGTDAAALGVRAWPGLAPEARPVAWRLWLARPESAVVLLDAVEQGRFPPSLLRPWEKDWLRRYPSLAVNSRAQKLFGPPLETNRVERLLTLRTNLPAQGVPARGRLLFQQHCASCHRYQGLGTVFGPDLEAAAMRGRHYVLQRLLEPNQTISSRAELRWVDTADRGYLLGAVVSENPAGVWVRTVDGETLTVSRLTLRSMSSLGRSAMPEGWEQVLTVNELADLLSFLVPGRADSADGRR